MNLILYFVSCALISLIANIILAVNHWDLRPCALGMSVVFIFNVLEKLLLN